MGRGVVNDRDFSPNFYWMLIVAVPLGLAVWALAIVGVLHLLGWAS